MAAASATAASTPRAAPAPRATRRTPTPRHGALAGLTSSRAIRAAAAGASQDVAVDVQRGSLHLQVVVTVRHHDGAARGNFSGSSIFSAEEREGVRLCSEEDED